MIANKEEKKFFDIFLVFNLSFCTIATSSMQHTLFKATTHLKSMTWGYNLKKKLEIVYFPLDIFYIFSIHETSFSIVIWLHSALNTKKPISFRLVIFNEH